MWKLFHYNSVLFHHGVLTHTTVELRKLSVLVVSVGSVTNKSGTNTHLSTLYTFLFEVTMILRLDHETQFSANISTDGTKITQHSQNVSSPSTRELLTVVFHIEMELVITT